MSRLKVNRKADGWWLEINNDRDNNEADALIFLGEMHGPIVERALQQAESAQADETKRFTDAERDDLDEALSTIRYRLDRIGEIVENDEE